MFIESGKIPSREICDQEREPYCTGNHISLALTVDVLHVVAEKLHGDAANAHQMS